MANESLLIEDRPQHRTRETALYVPRHRFATHAAGRALLETNCDVSWGTRRSRQPPSTRGHVGPRPGNRRNTLSRRFQCRQRYRHFAIRVWQPPLPGPQTPKPYSREGCRGLALHLGPRNGRAEANQRALITGKVVRPGPADRSETFNVEI